MGINMKKFLHYASKIIFSRTLIIFLMLILQVWVLIVNFTWLGGYLHLAWEGMTLLGAGLIIYIINKDEPAEFKLTWIIPICLLPVLGGLIYLFVMGNIGGLGLRTKYGRRLKETEGLLSTGEETREAMKSCSRRFQGMAYYMEHTAGCPAYHNSTAVYYPSGEDKLRDLLEELKKAEKFIFLEYFIIERGSMWDSVLEILKEKAKQGVEVRVMYDGMCSILLLPHNYPKKLQEHGIRAKMFAPIRPFLSTNQNNRDHRKIVVIDGKVAFTGGINLADEYINVKKVYGHWKDVAVKITGDAVRSFTVMFLQMWNVSEKGSEDYERYLKDIKYDVPLYHDGFVIPYGEAPTREAAVAKDVYENMLDRANRYIHMMSPYFIVDKEFLDDICFAAKRGVEVCLILPHIPDKKLVYYIARTYYPILLKAGIRVYEYTPGFVHAKAFVSDDRAAVVGTINLDYRSFYHHFECGAYFYENSVVYKVEEDFQNTLQQCLEVTMEYYRKIPFLQKLLGRIFKLIGPLM